MSGAGAENQGANAQAAIEYEFNRGWRQEAYPFRETLCRRYGDVAGKAAAIRLTVAAIPGCLYR
jgi:hypothetical protein